MPDCLFCKIISGELPSYKVYEDNDVLAFLDIHPVNVGHTLVIPKEHAASVMESSAEALTKVMLAVKKIAPVILATVGADSFNLHNNVGGTAGQSVLHTHFHIIPRLVDDGHQMWKHKIVTADELTQTAEKIRQQL